MTDKPETIWLINPYGPIPGEGWRDYRFTIIGEALAARGYEVIWWTSTFSHHFKKQRARTWEDRILADGFVLRLVPTPAYRKNVGFGRMFRDFVFGVKTYWRGRREQRPDLIFFYESPLSLGLAGYWLGCSHKTKMIFDQMDLWPEMIERALSPSVRLVMTPLLKIVYMARARIYSQLHGSVALATPYLNAMHRAAPILRKRPSAVSYNGIDVLKFRRTMAETLPVEILRPKRDGEMWVVFAGSLGDTYDIRTLLAASALLRTGDNNIVFILAGDGPLSATVSRFAAFAGDGNFHYLGKLDPEMLIRVYASCDVGLCAYSSSSNVEMPDKIYDYTAAGLAVVNSLTGEVARVIEKEQFGLQYKAGDHHDLAAQLLKLYSNQAALQMKRKLSYNIGSSFDRAEQMQILLGVVHSVLVQARV